MRPESPYTVACDRVRADGPWFARALLFVSDGIGWLAHRASLLALRLGGYRFRSNRAKGAA